jgi:AraC-like DNA-binding protein
MKMLEFIIPPLPQFVTVGHSWWKQGQAHFRRSWSLYDLIIVTNGTLYMTEDDQPYTITAGSMLLLEPGRTHFGHLPCEQNTETYYVHFSHPVPPRELNSGGFEWMESLQQPTDDDHNPRSHAMYLPKHTEVVLSPLLPILDRMVEIRNHIFIRNALELHSLTAQLLLELQQVIYQTRPMSRSLELCTRMARYLENHMQEPFSSKKLEDELHYHIDYLSRCLKKHTGMTPLQYQQHIRMERAKQMLAHTMTSIQEIAYEVGYEHSSYFIRIFRSKEGITPGAYRERFLLGAK